MPFDIFQRLGARRVAVTAVVGIVTVAACVSGCTTEPGVAALSTNTPATSSISMTGTPSIGDTVPSTSTGSPSLPDTTAQVSGQTLPTTTDPIESPVTLAPPAFGAVDPTEAALEALVPGLYGLTAIGSAARGSGLKFSTSGDCGFVLDVLRAGQWSMELLASPDNGTHTWLAVMTLGDRAGLLALDDSNDACAGTLSLDRSEQLDLTGDATTAGNTSFLPLMCLSAVSGGDVLDERTVIGVYRAEPQAYLLLAAMPAAPGKHTMDPDSDQMVMLSVLDQDNPLAQAADLFKALFDPFSGGFGGGNGDGGDAAIEALGGWESESSAKVRVTVAPAAPFSATITGKLSNPDHPASTVDFSGTVSCDS